MNLTSLKYALEIEKCGSVTNAARHLCVSQPNLSKIIKELEQSIGFCIFVRKNKGMAPTKKGKEFLAAAQKAVDQFQELENFCQAPQEGRVEMSIAVPRASYITHGFTRFVQKIDDGRGMEITFNETSSVDVINDIVEQKYSTGIIRYDVRYEKYFLSLLQLKGLTYEEVLDFEYIFIMSLDNPLAGKDKIYYEDLKDCVEILHGDTVIPSLAHGDAALQKERNAERCIYVYERGSQFDLLADETNTFMWVSPLPGEILERYHLFQKPCEDYRRYMKDIYVYPRGYQMTEHEKMFLEEVRQVTREIARG